MEDPFSRGESITVSTPAIQTCIDLLHSVCRSSENKGLNFTVAPMMQALRQGMRNAVSDPGLLVPSLGMRAVHRFSCRCPALAQKAGQHHPGTDGENLTLPVLKSFKPEA